MAVKDDLAFIAKRIRELVGSEPKDDLFVVSVWRLVRKAIDLGAFSDVRFTEFSTFFEPQREAETYNTRRAVLSSQDVTPSFVSKLPLTMLSAMKWLSDHGENLGLSMPRLLPKLGEFESVAMKGAGFLEFHIRHPNRDMLRPHIEFLASLIEGKRLSPRRKPPKGKAGRPRIEGSKETRDLELFDRWQTAKDAKIEAKAFCTDEDITIAELDRIVDWVATRRRRGQL